MVIRGKIRAYSEAVNAGIIEGSDGKEYPFAASEWLAPSKPVSNMPVVFLPSGNTALKINKA